MMPTLGKLSLRKTGMAMLLSVLLAVMPVLADDAAPQAPQPAPAAQQPPASQPAPSAPPAAATVDSLKVLALAGKDEANDLERKIMAPLVVQVTDQNDRPVESAEVVFRFPLQGPGATFPGGRTSQTVRTNAQGQAAAMNWTANGQVGRFEVHVSASYGNQVGQTSFYMSNATKVTQSNMTVGGRGEKRGGWFSPTWVKIAVIGGAAALAAGLVLATRGSSKASTSTVTISPGTPSIGGPH